MNGTERLANKVREGLRRLLDYNDSLRDAAVADWARALPSRTKVLDVGAGACRYGPLFAHCEYVAQDHPEANYAPAGVTVVRSDINSIPLPSSSIDAILCTEVFEHIEEPLAALEEFARILRPDGRLFLSVPAASRVHRVPTHYYGGFAPDFFENSLPRLGFVVDELIPIGNWSLFMAQELGRFPDVLRGSALSPVMLRRLLYPVVWPVFRLGLAGAFVLFSRMDRSTDLPLGWIALAHRSSGLVG